LGDRVSEVSIYAIILLSVTLLFLPVQQGYGFLTLSLELNDRELIELNKSNQIVLAEQARDEIFVLTEKLNPYLETPVNDPEYFENNEEKSVNSLDRNDEKIKEYEEFFKEASNRLNEINKKLNPYLETPVNDPEYFENNEEKSVNSLDRNDKNFQLVKDEQLSIAGKKYKELLGGKIILNSLNNEPINKKSTHEFIIDNQTGVMTKNSNGFQDYKLLQISIAEDFRDNNWGKTISQKKSSNPYLNDEPTSMASSIEENKISEQRLQYRQTEKFKNAIIEQIALAETYRNKILEYSIGGNPYLDENIDENLVQNIDENIGESLGISNRNLIITGWSDPTYVPEELEINIIDRESNGFEIIQALQIEIAQNTLDEMGSLPNSEEINDEIISLTNENKLNDIGRGDQGFEFFKNKEIDAAEKKLMEILGQKIIQNPDY